LDVLMAGARAVSSQTPLFEMESPQVVCISGHVDGIRLPLMVLTAWLLCVSGVQAIITAPRRAQGELHAGDILAVMGVPPFDRFSASRLLVGRGEPAFLPLNALSGALESWFDPRASQTQQRLAHLLAPLIDPVMPPASCRVLFADEPATARTWVALARARGIEEAVRRVSST
jgi:anthranilate phosphoribosyltransferase